MLGSNQRPPPCRGGALPAELIARGGPRLPTAPLALTVVRGDVAEWLRSGLQSRLHRFDSGRRLSAKPLLMRGSQRSFPHCALLGEPAPPADTSPATSIARFIGEVTAVDAGAVSVALHVVTVENLPGDQSEDDSTATTSLSPSVPTRRSRSYPTAPATAPATSPTSRWATSPRSTSRRTTDSRVGSPLTAVFIDAPPDERFFDGHRRPGVLSGWRR
jgi:hypothetical protein